jgi:ElaB/YqjD/DUF883 family membrane-anchored ribosome-binding protein
MKKLIVLGLIIGMMAVPALLYAENDRPAPQSMQGAAAVSTLRDDIAAMRNDLERLHQEAGSLAEQLQNTAHKDAATQIQGHVSSVLQRVRDMESKIDAESSGVMAYFKEGQAGDEVVKSK